MTAFRCTAKLLKAIRAAPEAQPQPARNRLGEWTANLLRVSRIQWVIAVSEPTRFGVVLDAAPYAAVPERFGHALLHALIWIGIPAETAAAEVEAIVPMQIAASASRLVLGTLNQYAWQVGCGLRYGTVDSAAELTHRLAHTIIPKPEHIRFPADRVREAFGLAPLDPRERLQTLLGTDATRH